MRHIPTRFGAVDETISAVIRVAARHLERRGNDTFLDIDAELPAMGFDSLRLVEFMLDLEKSLSVEFPADLINRTTFRTLRTVAESIRVLRERPRR